MTAFLFEYLGARFRAGAALEVLGSWFSTWFLSVLNLGTTLPTAGHRLAHFLGKPIPDVEFPHVDLPGLIFEA